MRISTPMSDTLRPVLRKLFDIRDGEYRRCILMFTSLFLLIAAMMMVKPVSTALFLSAFSARQLPFVYVLTALLAAVIFAWYASILRTFSLASVMRATLGSSIAMLLVFWGCIQFHLAKGVFLYLFLNI